MKEFKVWKPGVQSQFLEGKSLRSKLTARQIMIIIPINMQEAPTRNSSILKVLDHGCIGREVL